MTFWGFNSSSPLHWPQSQSSSALDWLIESRKKWWLVWPNQTLLWDLTGRGRNEVVRWTWWWLHSVKSKSPGVHSLTSALHFLGSELWESYRRLIGVEFCFCWLDSGWQKLWNSNVWSIKVSNVSRLYSFIRQVYGSTILGPRDTAETKTLERNSWNSWNLPIGRRWGEGGDMQAIKEIRVWYVQQRK